MSPVARFDRSAITALLLLGDLAIILLQFSAGLLSHGIDPLASPAYTAETLLSVGLAWVVAALVGLGLRATPWLNGGAPVAFVAVTIGVGLATLLPWRLVATAISR